MVTADMKLKTLGPWKEGLGRKAVTNLDSILKGRNITLPSKVCIVKAMVYLGFPGGSDGKESACSDFGAQEN